MEKWSILAKCGICKERKIQKKIKLSLQRNVIAINGILKENGICKEWNLQETEFARKQFYGRRES